MSDEGMEERWKLHRKSDPLTSKAAAYNVDVTGKELFVLSAIRAAGAKGATSKEIALANLNIANSSITARPKGLEEKGLIYYAGDKRDGARVMRLVSDKELQSDLF